ncbi:complement inhibitor SCIN family protein [Staphylococcus hyicus]|uniref:complement inhibitor SCIN family protein n=1 Tax=Staphylococcus hyicus TaxID=1284 RepID=UPI00208F8B5B|nr:complement inhibitor SCIN family protein [Staphylococcus hyicus]MCO4330268.1 complement inhibitor SCIN family protein [Staphylococcus hyicus]MCO4335809.1 complement inhibitor SCIN family protein [Staphylococcus hyicus]
MNMKSLIITGFAATMLATSAFSTVGAVDAQASTNTHTQLPTDNAYHTKKMEQELQELYDKINVKLLSSVSQPTYFKRELSAAKFKAKSALKSKKFDRMAQSKAELERLYDQLARTMYPDNY